MVASREAWVCWLLVTGGTFPAQVGLPHPVRTCQSCWQADRKNARWYFYRITALCQPPGGAISAKSAQIAEFLARSAEFPPFWGVEVPLVAVLWYRTWPRNSGYGTLAATLRIRKGPASGMVGLGIRTRVSRFRYCWMFSSGVLHDPGSVLAPLLARVP